MCRYISTLLLSLSIFSAASTNASLSVFTEHFPPYTVVTDGQAQSGIAYELVKSALDIANIDSSIDVIPWARAYELTLTQPNVVLFSMAKTSQRAPLFNWLYKFTTLEYSFYSNRDSDVKIASIKEALRYTTVAIRGSYEETILKSMGFVTGINLVLVTDMGSAWKMLDKRRVQTIYASHIPNHQQTANNISYFRHSKVVRHQELYVVASLSTPISTVNRLKEALQLAHTQMTHN
ncbi:substrate-binding periplasmic protein [Pseudoalteromonas sp. T1lg23B]|uniref:substrate-binding periplasmic protein n=1 Tax=Pseudoalteromonas sp. T1lg23B TaxID=2077097 RepID=UPI000CF75096|nr:transporter substrate-binding domain-containing protein [Pseudoalteromonas sp. T1lg23B]